MQPRATYRRGNYQEETDDEERRVEVAHAIRATASAGVLQRESVVRTITWGPTIRMRRGIKGQIAERKQ